MMLVDITIKQFILQASEQLQRVSDTAKLDAELLLCHLLDVDRSYLLSHSDSLLTVTQQEQYQHLLQRRLNNEPVAYILGYREFWSKQLQLNAATLIPRPETELLVEMALQKCIEETAQVVELGTGSGAIAIALSVERPKWHILATDISTQALTMAQQNATVHRCQNISFRLQNWCDGLQQNVYHAVISNPPYLRSNDPHLQTLEYEPRLALVSGDDGLQALQQIINCSFDCLLPQGWLLLEHGFDQAQAVGQFFQQRGYLQIELKLDYANLPRVTLGKKP